MDSIDFLKSPDEIKHELDQASEQQATAVYEERRLEEHKKILESKLTIEYDSRLKCGITKAKVYALADDRYENHINGLIKAEENSNRLKSKYANLQAYLKYLITWITTQRDLSK